MTRYSFTGPSRLRPGDAPRIHAAVAGLEGPTEIITGCAPGVDTSVAITAALVWPHVTQTLAVPDGAPSNAEALKGLLRGLGATVTVIPVRVPGGTSAEIYRARNDWLVRWSDELVALLRSRRFYRSGEWMTVNIARRAGRPVRLVDLPPPTFGNRP